jgi:hypothetical protein
MKQQVFTAALGAVDMTQKPSLRLGDWFVTGGTRAAGFPNGLPRHPDFAYSVVRKATGRNFLIDPLANSGAL